MSSDGEGLHRTSLTEQQRFALFDLKLRACQGQNISPGDIGHALNVAAIERARRESLARDQVGGLGQLTTAAFAKRIGIKR